MKVIFLDVDGVLNNIDNITEQYNKLGEEKYFELCRKEQTPFDNKCLNNLFYILNRRHINIVLSSTWRLDERSINIVKYKLGKYAKRIIGVTPYAAFDVNPRRGNEIKQYLDKNKGITEYCIIDDDNDMLEEQLEHFVHTSFHSGLTRSDANKVLNILYKKEKNHGKN